MDIVQNICHFYYYTPSSLYCKVELSGQSHLTIRCWELYDILGQTQKNETNPTAREPRVGGERRTAIEHGLTRRSVTRLSSIVLLSTSGRIFRYRCVLILCRKMSDCKSERVNIKFLVKLKKSATETFQLLTEAYSEDCMSRACV